MRRSKRLRSPDGWMEEYSWEEKVEVRKRPRRNSQSGDRDKKPLRQHHHFKTYERCRLDSGRLEGREHRAREPSVPPAAQGLRNGPQSTSVRAEPAKAESAREREKNREWHHYSKSSARSGKSHRSSRTRHRSRRHSRHSRHSDPVRHPPPRSRSPRFPACPLAASS